MAIKLDFQAAPVSRFQQEDPYRAAAGELGKGVAISNALGAASEVGQEYAKLRDERDIQGYTLQAESLETARLENYDAKLYYSGDELEGTTFKGELYEQNAQGESKPKTIPRWQAEPHIKKRDSLKDLETSSSGITNKRLRNQAVNEGKKAIENQYQKDLGDSIQEGIDHSRLETSKMVEAKMQQGSFDTSRLLISQSSLYTSEEKAEWNTSINRNEEFYDVRSILVKPDLTPKDIQTANQMIEDLGDDYSGDLEQTERIALQAQLKSHVAKDIQKKTAGRSLENLAFKTSTYERMQNGDPSITIPYLLKAVEDGLINQSTGFTFSKEIIAKEEIEREKVNSMIKMNTAVEQGFVPPRSSDNQGMVNDIFNKGVEEAFRDNPNMGMQERYDIALQATTMYKMVPKDIIGEMIGADRDDGQALLFAAKNYNRFLGVAPESMSDFPDAKTSVVADVAAGLRSGMSESEAVKYAQQNSQMDDTQRDMVRARVRTMKQSKDWMGGNKLEKNLTGMMESDSHFQVPFTFGAGIPSNKGGLPSTEGGFPPDMVAQFENNYERYIVSSSGNEAVAMQKAYIDLQQSYGITNINSPTTTAGSKARGMGTKSIWAAGDRGYQFMAYPPVSKDDPETTNMMRNDIELKYRDSLRGSEKLFIYSDTVTLSQGQQGAKTSYPVMATDGDGNMRVIGRWSVDGKKIRESWERKLFEAKAYEKKDHWEKSLARRKGVDLKENIENTPDIEGRVNPYGN
jgi:hypothetical protein